MNTETIFIYLLGEGTGAWAPVQAQKLDDGKFRLLGPMPEDQDWEFAPGDIVSVKPTVFGDGSEALAAVAISN